MIAGWKRLAAIAAGTLVSEDLTTAGAGLLVRSGELPFGAAFVACAAGIYVGDLLLWGIGHLLGPRVLRHASVARRVPTTVREQLGRWIDGRLPSLIISTRFLPGSRLPLYLAAGACGQRRAAFALWTLVAVLLWTPVLLLVTSAAVSGPIASAAWPIRLAAAGLVLLTLRGAATVATVDGRRRVRARLTRLLRREYWPSWTLYAPLAPWFALLALRYGGVRTVAAANPAIPGGGFVGESKGDILGRLPYEWTLQGFVIDSGEPARRLALAERQIELRGWPYPLIYKPDSGQRGVGVRLIRSREQAETYLRAETGPVLVQVYHPGPFEAGIFYYRMPNEARGRIFSITDKHFPFVVGDGLATLEELIWRHPRLHAQAGVFLTRLGAGAARIPPRGERVSLAIAGNHAQGTMFLDGGALWSEALERRVDEIARGAAGLFIGRFDVRYSDVARFRRGEDLSIVEFNGVTAEPTDIYDPRRTIVSAWVTLARQWLLTFRIGAANRARGMQTPGVRPLARQVALHLRSRPPHPVSD